MRLVAHALVALLLAGCSQATVATTDTAGPARSPRVVISLDRDWMFRKGPLTPGLTFNSGGDWQPVTLPHTWNAQDGQDGGAPYFRGDGWYRRDLDVTDALHGKELYLRFLGASRRSEVLVNGQKVGGHTGGMQAFAI